MKFSSSLRDPVYGVVPITSIEQEILKLPILNRLKNIKQLGLAYLAFPGANHTRFEHSVGAMHVAYLMATALELDEHHIETVRIASLLHDVGHQPFSHSIEFASNLFGLSEIPDHKEATMEIIINSEPLKAILKRAKPLVHIENIAKLAVGKFTESMTLKCIIDGPIDADKIDYILRDNHHCGFPVALDINTISEILKKDINHGLVITPEGQSFAEQLFMGRYHLISKIHHNLKNRLGNYLLALSLKEAWNKTDKKEENAKAMSQIWTDMDLLAFLKENAKDTYPILTNHLLGDETFHEICNFGYADMTPLARYSAAILSKYPIILSNDYNLPSNLQERVFIHCVVEISPSIKIDVFCTHIGIRTENKSAQIAFLLEKKTEISTSSKQVLMGDFNLQNDTLEIANVLSYFNDTATEFGATYRASIDYIFATGYQDIIDYHVITDMLADIDSPAEFGSDHLPVVSIIDFS